MKPHSKVIAIDGPTASGKGTVAKLVATMLNFSILDTGAFYRAFACIYDGIEGTDVSRITWENGLVHIDNMPVTDEMIRTPAIDKITPIHAQDPRVRKLLLPKIRSCSTGENGLVADGRDIGSVVFPDAKLKVFVTAPPEIRAHRRFKQYEKTRPGVDFLEILNDLRKRDMQDEEREEAPLIVSPGSLFIDTTPYDAREVAHRIVRRWDEVKNT